MSRRVTVSLCLAAVIALSGVASNQISRTAVERYVNDGNREHLFSVRRLWHIAPRPINTVPEGAILMRTQRDPEGKLITFPLPPRTPTPFAYAHSASFAPFVMKVQYGWADGGSRMSFGEGGETFVFSFFGLRPFVIKKRPSWYF